MGPPSDQDLHRTKVKGHKNMFHENGEEKQAGIAILISDKINFNTEAITREKGGHYIISMGSTQQKRYNPCKHRCTQYRRA